jgi:hypothetical protein
MSSHGDIRHESAPTRAHCLPPPPRALAVELVAVQVTLDDEPWDEDEAGGYDAAGAMARRIGAARPGSVAVGYADRALEPAADSLAHAVTRTDQDVAVERYRVGASVGARTGPETFGAFWWTAR